jgi:glutamate synthase (NADPH) small chain
VVTVLDINTSRIRRCSGYEFTVPADLVLVAIGFSHPEHEGLVTDLDLELDQRVNIKAGAFATSTRGIFTAGDSRIGQSLIVNAIADGRRCAQIVERYLTGGQRRPRGGLETTPRQSPR